MKPPKIMSVLLLVQTASHSPSSLVGLMMDTYQKSRISRTSSTIVDPIRPPWNEASRMLSGFLPQTIRLRVLRLY